MNKWIAITAILLSTMAASAQNWYQFGFRVSTQFPLNREYAEGVHLSTLRTVHFGGYFRAGMHVYGEVGFGYQYFKNVFTVTQPEGELEDMVETRHLVIPIKAVGDVPITKKIRFMPYAGIVYQPLLQVTENILGFDKSNIENHPTLLTTGFDFRLGFITLGVDYRYSFHRFFKGVDGQRPQYIGISAGVIF